MNNKITTHQVGKSVAEVEDIVLDETPTTKVVFRSLIHNNGIRGFIFRFIKNKDGNIDELVPLNFKQLHENEGVKIELSTNALQKLNQKTKELKTILNKRGVPIGDKSFAVVNANDLVITDGNKATVIKKLLDYNNGEDFWRELLDSNPDLATKLAYSKLQSDRYKTLNAFKEMLANSELNESDWQTFFEMNFWIFGYGLRYQVLNLLQSQPYYGGTNVTGSGGERGDFLTNTAAEVKYTCLVEIKKPSTEILLSKNYRNGAYSISAELSGAISQVQVNCATWENEGSRTMHNIEKLSSINTISPKGIVVIGMTNQLTSFDMKNTFERFRNELHNPEIITFDELFERAKFIVGNVK